MSNTSYTLMISRSTGNRLVIAISRHRIRRPSVLITGHILLSQLIIYVLCSRQAHFNMFLSDSQTSKHIRVIVHNSLQLFSCHAECSLLKLCKRYYTSYQIIVFPMISSSHALSPHGRTQRHIHACPQSTVLGGFFTAPVTNNALFKT